MTDQTSPETETVPLPVRMRDFIKSGITQFKEHELREIVAVFCRLPGIAPAAKPGLAQCPDLWRPIETAPKDGTAILLTDARVLGWTQVAGWDEYQFRGETRWGWGRDDCDTYWHPEMFTHWMPIPQGPDTSTVCTSGEPHERTYLRGWNEAIERCAEIAESSAVTSNGTKIGIGIATKIRTLAESPDTSPDRGAK